MRTTLLSLLAFVLTGCMGYQIGPVKPKYMAQVTKIAIPTFKTQVLQPRVETLITNAVIHAFERDGTYKVTDEKDADAIIQCRMDSLDRRPNRGVVGNNLLTSEYALTMKVQYRITKRDGTIIDNRTASGQTYFFASGSNTLSADVNQDEEQAIPIAAEDMAKHLVSQVSEGW